MSGRAWRVAVTVLLAFGLPISGHSAASAHSELVSSSPADGESVIAPPNVVTLIFSAEVEPQFAQIAVITGVGSSVTSGDAVVEGDRVDQAVRISAGGRYAISYRIVSADGHPVQGQLSFTYLAPPSTTVPGATQPTSPKSSPSPTAAGPASGSLDNAASPEHSDWLFLGILGILVLAFLTIGIRLAVQDR